MVECSDSHYTQQYNIKAAFLLAKHLPVDEPEVDDIEQKWLE